MSKSKAHKALGYDFALLGLKARESRVEVIRTAAEHSAAKISGDATANDRVEMLAELATATYRLLDPRRRSKPIERIQLAMASEVEPVLATVAKRPLIRGPLTSGMIPPAAGTHDGGHRIAEPNLVQPASQPGFHKVSYPETSIPNRKLDRECRLGVMCLSVISTLIASSSLVAWIMFG